MTDRNTKNGKPATNEFDLVGHAAKQFKKEREIAESVADVTKRLEAFAERLRKTKERQKAAERDQRLLRPAVATSQGALAAHVLLKALNTPDNSVVVDLLDWLLATTESAEAERIKELRGLEVITVAALSDWLGVQSVRTDEPTGATDQSA